jgi:hypothetical protein
MTSAVNQGVPVVISNRESAVARDLVDLATKLLTEDDASEVRQRTAGMAAGSREKSGSSLGKLRLPSFSGKKGAS